MLRKTKMLFAATVLTPSTLLACTTGSNPTIAQGSDAISLCEAAKLPIGPNGINVTIEGEFESDRIERSWFGDKSCPTIRGQLYATNPLKDEAYQEFEDVLWLTRSNARIKAYGTLTRESSNNYRFDVIRLIKTTEEK